jgi:hypothetical protein
LKDVEFIMEVEKVDAKDNTPVLEPQDYGNVVMLIDRLVKSGGIQGEEALAVGLLRTKFAELFTRSQKA